MEVTEQQGSSENLAPLSSLFTNFDISDSLKNRLTAAGFITPTPVQAGAIPPALEGRDILATASTGTGKTLSFLVPILEKLDATSAPSTRGNAIPSAPSSCFPTRELAMQVLDNYAKLMPGAKHDAVLDLRRPLREYAVR